MQSMSSALEGLQKVHEENAQLKKTVADLQTRLNILAGSCDEVEQERRSSFIVVVNKWKESPTESGSQ